MALFLLRFFPQMLRQWVQKPDDLVSKKLRATAAAQCPKPKTQGPWAKWTAEQKREVGAEVHRKGVPVVYNPLRLARTKVPRSTLRDWGRASQVEEVLRPIGRPRVLEVAEEATPYFCD